MTTHSCNTRLPRASAHAPGVDPAGMQAFLDDVHRRGIRMHSILVLRHGAVAYEGYWAPYGPDLPHALHSVTKGLVSTAFGLLAGEGRITADTRVTPYFPDYAIPSGGNWEDLTVGHLLSMTCGHDHPYPFLDREDYQTAFFDHPLTDAPGTHFCYTNLCFYTLCHLLHRIIGQNLQEYLQEKLFTPMGIHSFSCGTSPTGISHGASLGFLSTEDMAKVGLLYLQQGRWNGKQLLPAGWIRQASAIQIADTHDCDFDDAPDGRYGYGFALWRCRVKNAYRFYGIFGQHILVLPDQDAVVVTTGGHARSDEILQCVWEHLLPAMTDAPAAPAAYEAVCRRLASLQIPLCTRTVDSPAAARCAGQQIVFAENRCSLLPAWLMANRAHPRAAAAYTGLHSCALAFSGPELTLTLREGQLEQQWTIPLGGTLTELTYRTPAGTYSVAACAGWTGPDTLRVDMLYLNFAQHAWLEFVLRDEDVQLRLHELPAAPEYGTSGLRELTGTWQTIP